MKIFRNLTDKNSLSAIQNWPVWILAGIIWLLIQLPYQFQLKIGRYMGLLAMRFATREKKITETNLNLTIKKQNLFSQGKKREKRVDSKGLLLSLKE